MIRVEEAGAKVNFVSCFKNFSREKGAVVRSMSFVTSMTERKARKDM